MLSRANSCGLLGINGYMVCVETDISKGIPAFDIVGLGDVAVKEAKDSTKTRISNMDTILFFINSPLLFIWIPSTDI